MSTECIEVLSTRIDQKVRLCKVRKDGEILLVQMTHVESQKEAEEALREGRLDPRVDSEHVCPCLRTEVVQEGERKVVRAVMSCKGSSLHVDYERRASEGRRYAEEELIRITLGLTAAYSFLQRLGIAHRDVRLNNVVLDSAGEVWVCPYGYSKACDLGRSSDEELLYYFSPKLRAAAAQGKQLSKAQHNPFKSDVFALGVLLAHLVALEPPEFVRSRTQAEYQRGLSKFLDEAGCEDPWPRLLQTLLAFSEEDRPDFIELASRMAVHTDDEQLAAERRRSEFLTASIHCGFSPVFVDATRSEEVPCMIQLQASPHIALDVVCVADESVVWRRDVLLHLVDSLTPDDRMALVGFSEWKKTALIRMTDAQKQTMRDAVQSLETQLQCDAIAAVYTALAVLEQRVYRNSVAVLFLFLDGNYAESTGEAIRARVCDSKVRNLPTLRVHCFGVRAESHVQFLESVANLRGGHCTPLSSCDKVDFSCVWPNAHSISIAFDHPPRAIVPCSVTKVGTKEGVMVFTLPQLNPEKRTEFVFLLRPTPTSLPQPRRECALVALLSYTSPEGIEVSRQLVLEVKFSPWGQSRRSDDAVLRAWSWVKAEARRGEILALTEEGRLDEAEASIAETMQDIAESDARRVEEMTEWLKAAQEQVWQRRIAL